MKLAKKNDQAVLSFEISGTSKVGMRRVKVTHDVKIEVLKPGDVERLGEPLCPEPDVSLVRILMLLYQPFKIRSISSFQLFKSSAQ